MRVFVPADKPSQVRELFNSYSFSNYYLFCYFVRKSPTQHGWIVSEQQPDNFGTYISQDPNEKDFTFNP
jgi:hypothetical protein